MIEMTNKVDVLFDNTVKLFKLFGDKISCENGILRLSEEVTLSSEQATALKYLFENASKFRKCEITINWDDATSGNIIANAECTGLKVELSIYDGNKFNFYKNEKDLFEKLSLFLIQGKNLPDNYYFIDDDFRSDSDLVHPSLLKLKLISEWIEFLTKISDIDKKTDDGIALYYFIKGEDDKFAKPLEVRISNLRELINIDDISTIEDISKLVSEDESGNLHHRDRQSFFKLALVDTLKKLIKNDTTNQTPSSILFKNLSAIKNAYYEHYDIFIHNFAIGEFQQQVEEKGFDYSEKISSVLNDIQIRLYAIPIVLVSLGALAKVDNVYSYFFIVSGVIITALFNHWMINDQVLRLEQIKKSSEFTFDKLKNQGHEKLESCDTLKNLDEIVDNIKNRIADRNTKIKYYTIFCWLPTVITIFVFMIKEKFYILNFFNVEIGHPKLDDLVCIMSGILKIINSLIS